jgi:hypothetical protein
MLQISCYRNTYGKINIVNTSVTFELPLKGINKFVDITPLFPIYMQSEFISEDTAVPTPKIFHLPVTDLIY